jgi:hypothetical protein
MSLLKYINLSIFLIILTAPQISNADQYILTETLAATGTTDKITAIFNGTANGNIVTNLTNISVFINGTEYDNLTNNSLDSQGQFITGGAQVSFDGLQNNYRFREVPWPQSTHYEIYDLALQWYLGAGIAYTEVGASSQNNNEYASIFVPGAQSKTINYSLVDNTAPATPPVTASPVPAPASIILFLSGIVGLVFKRGKAQTA